MGEHSNIVVSHWTPTSQDLGSTVRFKRENPDLSLLDLKFLNLQGFGANIEISFIKYGNFMQKFAPFGTFVKIK